MDGSGMTPSAQTLPSPSQAPTNGFQGFINGHAPNNPQAGFNPDTNGSMQNVQNMSSFRSIPLASQTTLLAGYTPERYQMMLGRAEALREAGWTEQTSGDLASVMALLNLWQKQMQR